MSEIVSILIRGLPIYIGILLLRRKFLINTGPYTPKDTTATARETSNEESIQIGQIRERDDWEEPNLAFCFAIFVLGY